MMCKKVIRILILCVFLLSSCAAGPIGAAQSRAERSTIAKFLTSHRATDELIGAIEKKPVEEAEELDPLIEERLAVELQLEFERLYSELERIHEDYKRASPHVRAQMKKRDRAFIARLKEVDALIVVSLPEGLPYIFYQRKLHDEKKRREDIYRGIEKAHRAGDIKRLQALNLEAIYVNRELLKLRIKVATMLMAGEYRLSEPTLMYNSAMWTLAGALFNAKELENELHFRNMRIEGGAKRKEFESADVIGELVKKVRLGGYDIDILQYRPGDEPTVVVHKAQWINVHTHLDEAARFLKYSTVGNVRRKVEVMLRHYGRTEFLFTRHYEAINDILEKVFAVLEDYEAHVRIEDGKVRDTILRALMMLKEHIREPKIKIFVEVDPATITKALSRDIKTIARYEPEYFLIMQVRTNLEYYIDRLKFADKMKYLSKERKNNMLRELRALAQWTERGFVYPKQFSLTPLNDAADYLAEGNNTKAIEKMAYVVGKMTARLKEIDRITSRIKSRAEKRYAEYLELEELASAPLSAA
ncbi:MAG: hypothetical protein JW938_06385 [Candidatus Omnitrophica bacterium]|nr:hypothetical protein [Candidatus Omnitrophota bacterium]